ncbi:DMT family transporter [Xiamenia xianingshaonis]|uniref:DMT family transporter n=1 Tax=Xiamenia xianingshaonis TaxID=2682776 RepID=A0A9E6MQ89_9ACTN|nr:DMT family transporter [Xiamenia xianingshaonis]NGM18354.1 EamA family transporter [Eggerthellaceae bacterium zg-893]NHM15018.1 EamA family transporter [Xiamenia xianingshaonis]NHM17037.1 EamA family transporter [Xiamenia xianingshaonis]QTU84266.1 DMT family transporter [Xiamenia xianingshaonis]
MNPQAKYKLIGFVMMFASSSLMGGIGAFARFIDAPGDFISFWRNFAGLIALSLIFCFIPGMWGRLRGTRFSGMMLLSGIFLGLLSGLYCLSTQYTTLANASFLIYCGPVYSTILAAIFLKEKVSWKGMLCIGAVIVGMLFIVGIVTPEGLTLDLDPKYAFGNAIAFASGVAYGLYLFFSRYRTDVDSNVRAWYNFLFGSLSIVVLLIWHHFFLQPLSYTEKVNGVTQFDAAGQIITHPWNMFTMPGSSWIVLIAAALITGFGAFYLLTCATRRLKAGELAAISYQETIMASALGLLMFNETMTTFQLIGGALIIIGGVCQIVFSTKAASEVGEKIEATDEIRENLERRLLDEEASEELK